MISPESKRILEIVLERDRDFSRLKRYEEDLSISVACLNLDLMRAPCARFFLIEFKSYSVRTRLVSGVKSGADWRSSSIRLMVKSVTRFS